jgi:putative transcriptional regulator
MNKFPLLLALACGVISNGINADDRLGKGKLLVATEAVQGPAFAESVVLILNYSAAGAEGLVVNRPTEVPPIRALPELAGLDRYEGTLYWGGPVEPFTLRALLHSDAPPDNAMPIFDTVHLAPLNENLFDGASSDVNLRFFAGYAGWAPGQLEHELEIGSWHIVAATEALVFTDDPGAIWQRLSPPIRAQGPDRQDKNNPLRQAATRMFSLGQERTLD